VVPGLFLVAVLIATRAGAATLLPINDDTSAPYLATIDGFPISTNTDGVATWLNRTRIIGEGTFSFNSGSTWNSLATNQPWLYVGTGSNANTGITTFVNEGNGRQMVICVPILVGPPDDSGPTSGPLAGQAVSLALGAAGTYNTYFYQMGQQLVANNLSNAILRLGWEFNGNWYAWKVGNDADAKNFAAFWKQIVNTLRTVPGQNFKYCWSGDVNWEGSTDPYPLADAYPSGTDASGKPYVDYAGTDAYDSSWSYYPWATGSTAAQILAIQKNVWANVVNAKEGSGYWGIPVWQAIAKANNVPFCIPEWGVSMDTHMGGDDTYYVQQMHDFIQTAANNVYFASYYDNEEYRLAPNGGYVTLMPNSAALYRQLFSPPPAAFSATAGNKQVALLWTASTAASSYAVMRATVSGGPYTTVASGLTNTTYTDTGVTNNTPYYYVITPTISGGAGVSTSEVSATPVESFATWAQGVFTSAQLSDNTISAWSDTPAHDGITNLMKYALGLAPMTPATINLAPQVSGGHLTLTFQRLSAPSDITYIVEASSDLNSADWSASGVTTVVTVPDTGSGLETVQATDSATSTPRFMRLRVTSP
jgi:hypothetical protein